MLDKVLLGSCLFLWWAQTDSFRVNGNLEAHAPLKLSGSRGRGIWVGSHSKGAGYAAGYLQPNQRRPSRMEAETGRAKSAPNVFASTEECEAAEWVCHPSDIMRCTNR
ncbi:hypothetical protein V8C44DRAFT_321814 [Trichoderma aethiopicum]